MIRMKFWLHQRFLACLTGSFFFFLKCHSWGVAYLSCYKITSICCKKNCNIRSSPQTAQLPWLHGSSLCHWKKSQATQMINILAFSVSWVVKCRFAQWTGLISVHAHNNRLQTAWTKRSWHKVKITASKLRLKLKLSKSNLQKSK